MLPMQRPTSPTSQRLRTLRRRVAAGALATFVAAWLAVPALGKGGSSSAAAAGPSSHAYDQSAQPHDAPGPVVTGQS
jgi:hypothetical protein